jgi:hypothetical protein
MRAHLEDRPRPIRELNPRVPAGLAQLVERCLAKAPERRPSAVEVADLLGRADLMHASASRGLAVAVVIAAAAVALLAGGAWVWLGRRPPPAATVPSAQVQAQLTLRVQPRRGPLQVRLGVGQEWRSLPEGPLAMAPGVAAIEVRAVQPGPLWHWRGEVAIPPGGQVEKLVELAAVPLPTPIRPDLAGEGMLFLNGRAFGLASFAEVRHAGTWWLGRVDGAAWRERPWTINAVGVAKGGAEHQRPLPDGPAWWIDIHEDGRPCPRHHLVSWWEAEQVRRRAGLPGRYAWERQKDRPEQPAVQFDQALVREVLKWAGEPSRLPRADEVRTLAGTISAPVWCDPAKPYPVDGRMADALLVLVPGRETPDAAPSPHPDDAAGSGGQVP